jgi:homocysteine S-methyltransferase
MTQPVYDEESIDNIYEATKDLGVPVFIGIMPLTGYRNAVFLHNEVPGIKIPKAILNRMEKHTDKQLGRAEGVAIARGLLDIAMEKFQGIYLMTPFSYWRMTEELTKYIREQDQSRLAVEA